MIFSRQILLGDFNCKMFGSVQLVSKLVMFVNSQTFGEKEQQRRLSIEFK